MNTTIRSFVSLIAVALCATFSAAQAAPTVTASAAYVSAYVFRGQQLAAASVQPTVDVTLGNLDFGAWNSTPAKRDGLRDESLEVDLYGSYTVTISPTVSVAPGVTYYVYPRAATNGGSYRSTIEPSFALTYKLGDLTLTPKAYYDLTLRSLTGELTAAHSLSLKPIGTSLDFAGTVGTYKATDAVNGGKLASKAWGSYWSGGVSAPFAIGKHGKLTLGYTYSSNWNVFSKEGRKPRSDDGTGGRGVVSVTYGLSL